MKIMMFKGHNPHFKDDTDTYAEGLTKLGHEVTKIIVQEKDDNLKCINMPKKEEILKMDVLWSPYERENIAALGIRNHIQKKIPIVGHYEWAPPWRTGVEEPRMWSYIMKPDDIRDFRKMYQALIPYWLSCDVITGIDEYSIGTIQALTSTKIKNWKIKPYIIDDELLLSQKDDTIKEKRQILSTARFVAHKKIHHVIFALSLLKDPPPYKVIGGGKDLKQIKDVAKKHNVNMEFVGRGQEDSKAKYIQESMFSVNIWAGLPIAESAIFKKPAITYEHPCSRAAAGDMATYVEWNNIKKLSYTIQKFIDDADHRKAMGQRSYDTLINNKAGIYTTMEAAKRMEKILLEAIK